MLSDIPMTCDAAGCERELDASHCQLVVGTVFGERRAYECDCGAVTISITGTAADDPPIHP